MVYYLTLMFNQHGCLDSVEWNGGMEYWNGMVERWNEHAHDSIDKNVMCS